MTDDNMRILLTGLISLASTALGGSMAFWVATRLAKRNAQRIAANDLRAAFAPEMAIVRTTPHHTWASLETTFGDPKSDLNHILRAAFERHGTAVEKYRFFVPSSSHTAYDAAWQEYYMEDGKIGFSRYMYGDSGQSEFFTHVDAILRFTD